MWTHWSTRGRPIWPSSAVEDEADEESEDYGLVILKSVTENGEELLSTLDDEAELEKIYDLFMEQLLADEE